jgi:hypothetical protein
MSALRHSISSTRRTRQRPGMAYRLLGAAAVAAEVAEPAEPAEPAQAADAALAVRLAVQLSAAELRAEAAVRPGDVAAGAKPDRFPTALTNAGHDGRVRQDRPGQSMSPLHRRAGVLGKVHVLTA